MPALQALMQYYAMEPFCHLEFTKLRKRLTNKTHRAGAAKARLDQRNQNARLQKKPPKTQHKSVALHRQIYAKINHSPISDDPVMRDVE